MERKILENPYAPSSQPPANLFNPPCRRFVYTENHAHTPLITSLHAASDQPIESAFSRLAITPDSRFHAQTPSFPSFPATLYPVASAASVPSPMAVGEKQQALFWAQAQSINGGVNGPFSPLGAHQEINVGPEELAFPGKSPYLEAGDHNLMKFHQRQDFLYAATCDNYHLSSSLHGKEQFSRKANNNCFPVLPSAHQSNLPSLYSNQQYLYRWDQQLTPENMRGKIVSLAKDQVGCSILELKLDEGLFGEEQIEMLLAEVMGFLSDLMRNQFGSHFVQKLFGSCNEVQRTRIITALTISPAQLNGICINSFGARGVLKLLEKLTTPQQISLVVTALSSGAISLATDPNGQHVIQYCVKHFPGEYNKQLFNEIADRCYKIATNKSGCFLLQLCVDNSHGETKRRLIGEIIADSVQLAQDPYGNYVVQHLLEMRIPEVTANLLRRFQGCFVSLSCDKFASNVVEKFFGESGESYSASIIMELLRSPDASMLLVDPFGNFVIQSALSVSSGPVREALFNLIRVNAPSMQSNIYGKKILAWFEKAKIHLHSV